MENNLDPEEFVKRLKKNGKKEETNLQRKVQEYLVSKGAYEFKVHGSAYMKSGIPDIISCYKGLFIGIECKIGKNKMSKSLGNYIGIYESAKSKYQKVMEIPDELIVKYY